MGAEEPECMIGRSVEERPNQRELKTGLMRNLKVVSSQGIWKGKGIHKDKYSTIGGVCASGRNSVGIRFEKTTRVCQNGLVVNQWRLSSDHGGLNGSTQH